MALASHGVKTLWAQWPRLAIKDGLLKRRFKEANGLSSYWQVIIPTSLRNEFVCFAHGGMTEGHFGRRRTSAAIQSREPTWRTDMEKFLRQCVPCARYHRAVIPDKRVCNRRQLVNLGKKCQWISQDLIPDLHDKIGLCYESAGWLSGVWSAAESQGCRRTFGAVWEDG